MKKILILTLCLVVLVPSFYFMERYSKNKEQIAPFPYIFTQESKFSTNKRPILILGDRFAHRFANFTESFEDTISKGFTKNIKIATMTADNMGIHRAINIIKNLPQMPFIVIYMQNLDIDAEKIFETKDINLINMNFQLYQNDYIKSLVMVWPKLSRLIYHPVKFKELKSTIDVDKTTYSDYSLQVRNTLNFKLYQAQLQELMNIVKKRNSILIPITTPLNVKKKPTKACELSADKESLESLHQISKYFKKDDYKEAYNLSKDLALINSSNSHILHLHAQISEKLLKLSEAKKYYKLAYAYDCGNRKGSPVYNEILKKLSISNKIDYIDFERFVSDQSYHNTVFKDELYTQDFYYEKLVDILSLKVKKLLKL